MGYDCWHGLIGFRFVSGIWLVTHRPVIFCFFSVDVTAVALYTTAFYDVWSCSFCSPPDSEVVFTWPGFAVYHMHVGVGDIGDGLFVFFRRHSGILPWLPAAFGDEDSATCDFMSMIVQVLDVGISVSVTIEESLSISEAMWDFNETFSILPALRSYGMF